MSAVEYACIERHMAARVDGGHDWLGRDIEPVEVAAGDSVELPTVEGPKHYRVAGIFDPQMVNDAAVGDIVLVSDKLARSDWAATRAQVAVDYPSSAEATARRGDFVNLGAGLSVYDNQHWR